MFADFIKKNCGFSKFNNNQILLEAKFGNFDHLEPSWGHVKSHKKFVPYRFICFDKQTDTLNLYIDM